jgi:hypothetical protein
MRGYWLASTLITLTTFGSSAYAQTTDTSGRAALVEAGGGISGLMCSACNGDFGQNWARIDGPLGDGSVRVNVSRRFAVEVLGQLNLGDMRRGVNGFWGVQVHQSLAAHGRITPFVTYGGTGLFEVQHEPELRLPTLSGDTLVSPAFTHRLVQWPAMLTGGGGVRVDLGHGLVLETGVQTTALMLYFGGGVTAHVGVMVPVTGWRSRS